MLPSYQRMSDDGTSTTKTLRSVRTRFFILLLFSTLVFVCLGVSLYVTNNDFLSANVEVPVSFENIYPDEFIRIEGSHILNDYERSNAMIPEVLVVDAAGDPLEIPKVNPSNGTRGDAPIGKASKGEAIRVEGVRVESSIQRGLPNGEDKDPVARERRNKVREMTLHAWHNYKLYAWGGNELRPLSKCAHTGSIFGEDDLGATIVDSIDTLYIMGLDQEYEDARDWIEKEFSLDNCTDTLSVFETNIRFVGGLLTMYAFTGDEMFKERAQHVAGKLIPAFQTPTGIPNGRVNVQTGVSHRDAWSNGGNSILSEFGSLHLEFAYLSDVTGDSLYRDLVTKIRQVLEDIEKPNGLYSSYLNPENGQWDGNRTSLGALNDSFYEYLLKAWIQNGQTESYVRKMYDDAMQAIIKNIIVTSPGNLTYACEMNEGQLVHRMEHLACFAGGMFALGSVTQQDENSEKYMEIGKGITNTCHESYVRTATHLGPEVFVFDEGDEAGAESFEGKYILRPETFESYFVLWRLTKDQKYRDWAWDAIEAIERYCRTPTGYSGISNVNSEDPQKDDVQQSFFLAEVLKYLYLIYSDDSLLPLNEWVFNTEAHPLPIKGHPMYRAAATGTNNTSHNLN